MSAFVGFMTQYNGVFIGPIAKLLGYIIAFIYDIFAKVGIENAALAIVLFTVIIRALMIPLNIKQQKATKLSSRMNPEIQKIQEKYKNKKDQASQAKMSEETQAVYEKYGANPFSGCLPLLITFPIMIGLYRVIYNIPAYIPAVYSVYEKAASIIIGTDGFMDILKGETLALSASQLKSLGDEATIKSVIDVLASLTPDKWSVLAEQFTGNSAIINEVAAEVNHINNVFGLFTINQVPNFKSITILVPIIAAGLQFFQSWQMQKGQPPVDPNNQAASMTKSMTTFMPIMTAVFCYTLPIGIGIYWITGSLFAIAQQFFVNKYFDKVDIDELIKQNQMKALKKKQKRGGDTSSLMRELANKSTKNIEVASTSSDDNKSDNKSESSDIAPKKNYKPADYTKTDKNPKASDIAAVANILKNNNKGE